jgi:2'-hydroxyisoflavone reductase
MVLIIGGTSFLGRATTVEALRRGDTVDLPGAERARCRRRRGAARRSGRRCGSQQLSGREFGGVVDTCGFVPRVVGKAAQTLAEGAGHYAFVSSISASGSGEVAGDDDEGPPCASDAGPADGDYGVLKAGCERAVREAFDRSTIARAGLILGPHENVGRLNWWLSRLARR